MTHLAFELRTSTPDSVAADLAERVEASGYRSLWVNHPPDEDGLGHLATMAAATTRITLGTAVVPISAVPPDAIFSDYAYFSSYSDSWVEHARRYAAVSYTHLTLPTICSV